jgi:glutaconyl-CoA decarboxylase
MKNFRVTVNGQVFDVAVEDLGEGKQSSQSTTAPRLELAPKPAPVPRAPRPVAAPKPVAAASDTPAPPVATAEGEKVVAPLPGTVTEIKVNEGAAVAARDGLLIIEAMKMENEIEASVVGTVKQVCVSPGQTVKAGEVLVVIG